MAEAPARVWDIDNTTESPFEAAATVWAVFEALDTVPAAADDQLGYLEARAVLEDHLASLGLPADRLRAAVPDLHLEGRWRSRGRPNVGR